MCSVFNVSNVLFGQFLDMQYTMRVCTLIGLFIFTLHANIMVPVHNLELFQI